MLWFAIALCLSWRLTGAVPVADTGSLLTKKIPPRPDSVPTGSEFARQVASFEGAEREQLIKDQLIRGNIPDFLRVLKPVRLVYSFEDGTASAATVFVMPDYLAIGSDQDFLLIPMNLYTALDVAASLGFVLPTRKLVDVIFTQSDVRLVPEPLPPGPEMTSTGYYLQHNRKIAQQRLSAGGSPGALTSGHKKDLVLTKRLAPSKPKVAIYGWHLPSGIPIQPLSTVHGATYADYSHGVRLVSEIVWIDGRPRSFYDALEDPRLSRLLSDEGTVGNLRKILRALQLAPAGVVGPPR